MICWLDMNPYASYLGKKDPVEVIGATPERLKSLLEKIGPAGADRAPAPGKWSVREILCHLADCEIVFAYRLRQTLAQPNHVIQPFDQDDWAKTYGAYETKAALNVFSATRLWNLALIRAATPEDLSKPVTHPERGAMTFQVVVETMAGHDINHLQQVEGIAR